MLGDIWGVLKSLFKKLASLIGFLKSRWCAEESACMYSAESRSDIFPATFSGITSWKGHSKETV